ncbi:MAG: family 1 glycosylhydrolase, partial [Myxococcales bacterium]|nr:family 1 glycosylhydrolase [Myxococcales bacterium]
AIKAADTIDADGDGEAARVGMTWATQGLVPADAANPADVAAADLAYYFQHRLFMNAVRAGDLDADFDGAADENHPEWANRIDWAGVQYYSAAAVVPSTLPPPFTALRCSDNLAAALGDLWLRLLDQAGCPPAPNLDFPLPGYEGTVGRHFGDVHLPEGIVGLLEEFATQYPDLPLFVTENGFGFRDGEQAGGDRVRAKSLVRHLAAIHDAIDQGIDVRGYFHWTLMDNWEWNSGNGFRIGLLDVDYATYDRAPNEAYRVYGEIAGARFLPDALYAEYGEGPLRDAE